MRRLAIEVHDVALYVQQDIPRPQFYIQDILPKEGVMLLYGNPKVKKSWLAEYMAFCVSLGLPFLGLNTQRAVTMLSNFEISKNAYGWRLKDMAPRFATLTDNLGWFYEVSPMLLYLDDDNNLEQYSAMIRPFSPKVIILDCMQACFGGDENNGQDMARFIEKVNVLRAEHEASIVLVHHTNKNILSNSSMDKVRGHSRLAGWVDSLVYMCEQPNGVQLQIKARQASREVPNIDIRFENFGWSVL